MIQAFVGGKAVIGSMYGKPNRTIILTVVDCTGTEESLLDCQSLLLTSDEGRSLYTSVNVAGVECTDDTAATTSPQVLSDNNALIGVGLVVVLLVLSVIAIVR